MIPRVSRILLAAGVVGLSLSGCGSAPVSAPVSSSGVFQSSTGTVVLEEAPELTPEQQAILDRRTRREEELLSRPLTAESAAEIALLHNPAVERALETLGLPGFDRLVIAHTLNPDFNNGQPPRTTDTRIERSLSVNVMTWLSVPALGPVTTVEERAGRVQAANEVGALLFAARRAWVSAVAARQAVRYLEDVLAAAEVSREIVESMRQVGNASEVDLLRAQALYGDAVARLTAAQVAAAVERERLVQMLGLWSADAERVQIPDRLPNLPANALGPDGLEARAVSHRFDVQAGRVEGLSGEAGVNARADVRTAWLTYRGAYDLARHSRDALLPLAERMSAEQLKLYNGMLIGVLDLIADAQTRITAVNAAMEAERDFWLAEIDLQRAMAGVGAPAGVVPGVPGAFQPGAAYHVH
ncbi:MAG TPA: TolC family protein [Gammaproteobacteria bacterium]